MNNQRILNELLHRESEQIEALSFFDRLETVEPNEIRGLWKGEELRTGHPMEGLLTASNWFGKLFINEEQVHPLVFQTKNGTLYFGNPGVIPIDVLSGSIPDKVISTVMTLFRPIIQTNKSKARLRKIEYRGKLSAAMIYDQKHIIDVFRRVDEHTLLGVMDIKNADTNKSYFFVLRKVSS